MCNQEEIGVNQAKREAYTQAQQPGAGVQGLGGLQARLTNQLYMRRARLLDQLNAVDGAIKDMDDPAVRKALNVFSQAEGL